MGIYVHVPFCRARCRYCDFVSNIHDAALEERYTRAVFKEITEAADAAEDAVVDTVYFGGGTPTTLRPYVLSNLLHEIRCRFHVAEDAEITVEANPETFTDAQAEGLAAAGFNRVSLGAQTFDDRLLRLIGRRHNRHEVTAAVNVARRAGFRNVSLDLMYGLPAQTLSDWQGNVTRALALEPDHISTYALTLAPRTRLAAHKSRLSLPCEDAVADMYYAAREMLTAAGYVQYELSNFAKPGRECRHNIKYWRDEDYIGIGPAAASHWRGQRFRNVEDIDVYEEAVFSRNWPAGAAEPSDAEREMRTAFVLGLRTLAGVDINAFRQRFQTDVTDYYREEIATYTAAGLLVAGDGTIRLSDRGLFLADEVFTAFI